MDYRILIIADDPLARAGLAGIVTLAEGLQVVGQTDMTSIADDISVYQPDVILWDLGWEASDPDLTTFRTAIDEVAAPDEGGIPVIVLSPDSDITHRLWVTGAHAVLSRDAAAGQIAASVQAVMVGLFVLGDEYAEALAPTPISVEDAPIIEELTPREHEVLQLLAEGLANKNIARRLDISEHTVKFHVNAILGKMGASSRTQAVVHATRAGLITL